MEDEYPECPICLDIYGITNDHIRAPKILDCGDSLCKECLERIIKKSNEVFLCPICKKRIRKNEKIDEYITNKQLIRLVNSFFNLPSIDIANKEVNQKGPITYKIISLGNSQVGKTCIFRRFVDDEFNQLVQPTVSLFTFKPYYVKCQKQKYKLIFYDTAGLEKNFNSIPKNYLIQSDGVLFIYDITDKDSFYNLNFWIDAYKAQKENVVGLIIGNKCDRDIEREVDYEEAKIFAKENNLKYYEISAKLDKNVKKAIASLLEEIIEYNRNYENVHSSSDTEDKFELDSEKLKEESFCSKICRTIFPSWFSK